MQILKWASSILERTDGDQWFSVLPKDCHTFEFSNVEGLNQDFYCCHGCVCLGKIGEGKKKRRNPSEERKGKAAGGKVAFNVKYGIFDFKN